MEPGHVLHSVRTPWLDRRVENLLGTPAGRGHGQRHGPAALQGRRFRSFFCCFAGRKFKGIEAKELGIVQRVYPAETLLEETVAYARDMADNVPAASLGVIKVSACIV
jgi:enoyl-CoA hydratase/carnithine racemase|eukprot:COSAG03_NODE_1587_length_3829_cov_3.242294_2_plen_108_part_00